MIAMEKSSSDPGEDFVESIEQRIVANRIHLNYYVSMDSEEYRGFILGRSMKICTNLFFTCKYLSDSRNFGFLHHRPRSLSYEFHMLFWPLFSKTKVAPKERC